MWILDLRCQTYWQFSKIDESLIIILEFQDYFCGILSESKFLLIIQRFMTNFNEFQTKLWILNTQFSFFCKFTKLLMSWRVEMCLANLEMTFFATFFVARSYDCTTKGNPMVLFKWLKLKLSVLSRSKEVLGFRWFDID